MKKFFDTARDLYATYAGATGYLMVYHRQLAGSVAAIHIDSPEDEWHEIEIDGQFIYLNFFEDTEIGSADYGLMAYPTRELPDGFREANTGIYQQINLEVI